MEQLFYYKMRQKFITKCASFLLKNVTVLLQNATVITNCDNFITKCDVYYKLQQYKHSRFTGQEGKGVGIYLTPLYQLHPLHWQLDVSQAIIAKDSLSIL